MQSLLTAASLPALPRLGPPVKASSELLEASVSVVDARREVVAGEGWTGNAGTCFPAVIFLRLLSCTRPCVFVCICGH